MRHHPRRQLGEAESGLRVGVIGLGAGTIAAYAQPGDTMRFYEINPRVAQVAEQYFTFEQDAPAAIEVVLGDARVQLERELAEGQAQHYDIFAVDAFSSGAIPTHLLTVEVAEVYRQHLNPDGLLIFHISNQAVDLIPVVRGLSESLGLSATLVETEPDESRGVSHSTWMILTSNEEFRRQPDVVAAAESSPSTSSGPALAWTDDFASLWRVLKF
jgi:spermidine synthase